MLKAALGLRAHSGWAVVVGVADGQALLRRRMELCDRAVAGSAQPYHAAAEMPIDEARGFLDRCAQTSAAMAEKALRAVIAELPRHRVTGCALLLGSGRPLPELARILAAHPLIHTAEGEFYREALRQACGRCGLRVAGIRERDIPKPDEPTSRRLSAMGKQLGPPWRLDEKRCALAAHIFSLS